MAVSSVSPTSSASAQQYGDDDTTTSANTHPANDPPASSTGNDADNAPSTQTDASAGQSTLAQIPPEDTAAGNTAASSPPKLPSDEATQSLSPSPGNEANNASSTPTDAPVGQSTLSLNRPANASTNTAISSPQKLSSGEAMQLLSRFDKDPAIPSDAANANSMAALQGESLRGAPPEAISFEQQVTIANQQVEALPSDRRDFYRGALAAGSEYYNAATTGDQREKIAQTAQSQVITPVNRAYQQVMSDPNARVQQVFGKPYGTFYLGNAGQQQSDRLAQLGQQFNHAGTPEERSRIFGQAADIRHNMQMQVGGFIDKERTNLGAQWKQADQEIDQAQRDAASLQIFSSGTGHDDSAFQRERYFITHGLNSGRNAQEFQYRLAHTPNDFNMLHGWADEATRQSQWATDHIQSDPLRRAADLPPLPPDPTHTNTENVSMGNFGPDLLNRYQTESQRIGEDNKMFNASTQHGPIRYEYLDAHTPPLPLWQQKLGDSLGRFFVGLVPGVNLLIDYIVPAPSLSASEKQGIDLASGVVSVVVPAPEIPIQLPKLGARKLNPAAEFKLAEEIKPPAEIKPLEDIKPSESGANGEPVKLPQAEPSVPAPKSTTPASGSPSGIPLVPDQYARAPSGKLVPDADYRGLYRDDTGQQFIQQGGQTYPVSYNKDAGYWQLQPREGWPNTRNMSIDEHGNWKVDLDKGLLGGVPEMNSLASGRAAFELYEQGYTVREIGRDYFHKHPNAINSLIDRYVRESGEVIPQQVIGSGVMTGRSDFAAEIYGRLTSGEPLQNVAYEYTNGDQLGAHRLAYQYARQEHLPVQNMPQGGPWRVQWQRPGGQPPVTLPVTYPQYLKIIEGDSARIPTWQLSNETGVPRPMIEEIRARDGYWSPQQQAWVALDGPPEYGPGFPPPGENPAAGPAGSPQPGPSGTKRPATNPDPTVAQPGTSGTGQPPVAAPAAPPSWGSGQLKQFHQDHTKLSGPVSDSIDAWLDGHAAPPSSLQGELNQRGFTDITPGMVRTYLTGQGLELTSRQMQRVSAFLSL